MTRKRLQFHLLLLLLCLSLDLAACGGGEPPASENPNLAPARVPDPTFQYVGLEGNIRGELLPQGSAVYLKDRVLLVSVFVNDGEQSWSEEEKRQCRDSLAVAVDWMEAQAKEHEIPLEIFWDEEDLRFETSMDGAIAKSQEEDVLPYSSQVEDYLMTLPSKALRKKYEAGSIGYLIWMPAANGSYTLPYEEAETTPGDKRSYNEFCTLYAYYGEFGQDNSEEEYESPATYAHEILHLFGACDLYAESDVDKIPQSLVDLTEENYPSEIMFYTYEDDNSINYDKITKMMSPYTLYFLDWVEEKAVTKELEDYPELKREHPAAF